MPYLIANTYVAGKTNLLTFYNHLLKKFGTKEMVKKFLYDYKDELKIHDNTDHNVYLKDFDFDNIKLIEKYTSFYGVLITSFQNHVSFENSDLYTTYMVHYHSTKILLSDL